MVKILHRCTSHAGLCHAAKASSGNSQKQLTPQLILSLSGILMRQPLCVHSFPAHRGRLPAAPALHHRQRPREDGRRRTTHPGRPRRGGPTRIIRQGGQIYMYELGQGCQNVINMPEYNTRYEWSETEYNDGFIEYRKK